MVIVEQKPLRVLVIQQHMIHTKRTLNRRHTRWAILSRVRSRHETTHILEQVATSWSQLVLPGKGLDRFAALSLVAVETGHDEIVLGARPLARKRKPMVHFPPFLPCIAFSNARVAVEATSIALGKHPPNLTERWFPSMLGTTVSHETVTEHKEHPKEDHGHQQCEQVVLHRWGSGSERGIATGFGCNDHPWLSPMALPSGVRLAKTGGSDGLYSTSQSHHTPSPSTPKHERSGPF